jgi:hypothetical protein
MIVVAAVAVVLFCSKLGVLYSKLVLPTVESIPESSFVSSFRGFFSYDIDIGAVGVVQVKVVVVVVVVQLLLLLVVVDVDVVSAVALWRLGTQYKYGTPIDLVDGINNNAVVVDSSMYLCVCLVLFA